MSTPEAEVTEDRKDFHQPIDEDAHAEGVTDGTLTVINAAEINQQIATARRYPRFPVQFRRRVFEMATYNIDIAESCIYALPRDGKMIDGPSIRFAEILQTAWGNCRSSTEVTEVRDEWVTSEGVFFDLESNMATKAKIMRRITNKHGKKFSADMIQVTGNAACSIALRNAILRGVPKALWWELFDETKKVAAGTQQTFVSRRDRVIKELGLQGATPAMIFGILGITGLEDMKTDHVLHLRGLQNAIKDGETSLEAAFALDGGKPGEATPPRPVQSEFTRETTAKTDTAPRVDEGQKPPAQASLSPREIQVQWYNEQKAALEAVMKLRDLAALCDAVEPELMPEQETEWGALRDAKSKKLVESAKAPKK